jgi:hypothetical protein
MAMDYDSYVASLANLMAADAASPEFQIFLPDCIYYAEKRIYRELDLSSTVYVADKNLTAYDRLFAFPPAAYGSFITALGINIIIPNLPQRIQLQPVSISFLNSVYGMPNTAGVPKYFGMLTQDTAYLGPYPDKNYIGQVIGTYRPEPLSPLNKTTYLTEYLADLFLAASCIYGFGYMRDFGGQSDNPQSAQSWEAQYQLLSKGANLESLRQKFAGPGWTSLSAVPVADSR